MSSTATSSAPLQARAMPRPNVDSAQRRTSWGEAFSSVALTAATSSFDRRFPGTFGISTRIARRNNSVQRESLLSDARIADLIPEEWSVTHDGNHDPAAPSPGFGAQPPAA